MAEDELVAALRAGDEAAFATLVASWSRPMLLLARGFVSTEASAQEVVQDTWLAVVRGLAGFGGRSSLRTWVYRILVNQAKTRGIREQRVIPWSSLAADETGPTIDPTAFEVDGDYPGHWRSLPSAWRSPEDHAVEAEVRDHLRAAFESLPERQRIVVTLRDVVGCSAEEVCDLLGVSAANQRVLLHRGRSAARAALSELLAETPYDDEPGEEVS